MHSSKEFPFKVYLVGGAVRDQLLGVKHYDNDWVVVGSTPEEMIELGFKKVGADFPVFLHPKTHEEYALARSERKSGKGYKGFITNFSKKTTLEEDLHRRDFTMNAIAQSDSGELIDPYCGANDINNRIIRHISDAFEEDPLRVLRGARFCAKLKSFDFSLAAETINLMRKISVSDELTTLPAERIWQETECALSTAHPETYIETLRVAHALKVLLPEVEALFGVPQPIKYHPEGCAGIHTLKVMERAAILSNNDPIAAFCALCHDLGKGTTPKELLPSHKGHEKRSGTLTKALCARLRVPNKYRDIAVKIAVLHMKAHQILEMRPAKIYQLLLELDALRKPKNLEYFNIVCEADLQGRGNPELKFEGANVLNNALGALERMEEKTIAQKATNDNRNISEAIQQARIDAIRVTLDKNKH